MINGMWTLDKSQEQIIEFMQKIHASMPSLIDSEPVLSIVYANATAASEPHIVYNRSAVWEFQNGAKNCDFGVFCIPACLIFQVLGAKHVSNPEQNRLNLVLFMLGVAGPAEPGRTCVHRAYRGHVKQGHRGEDKQVANEREGKRKRERPQR